MWQHSEPVRKLSALLICAALAAVAAPSAHAGTYTVHSCRTPDGGATDRNNWTGRSRTWDTSTRHNRCPRSAHEIVMDPGIEHAANDFASLSFWAPPDTDIEGYTIWRSTQVAEAYNYYFRAYQNGEWDVREPCTGGCPWRGDPKNPFGQRNLLQARGLQGVRALDVLLTCGLEDSSSSRCPASQTAARVQLHRTEVSLRDDIAPVIVTPPSGPLVDGRGPLSGVQPVSLGASDRGGGVYQVAFEVDGTVVDQVTLDSNGGRCRPPFTTKVPCKSVASGTVGFDTSKLPDGDHSLRLLVTDATGTNAAPWGPVTIRTANTSCNPEPSSSALSLTAGFPKRRRGGRAAVRRVAVTSYGRRLRVQGSLRTPDGQPVAGATLCAASRDALAGAPLRPQTPFTTDEQGNFTYPLGRGPSRRVYFVARVPDGAVSANVLVRVRAPVSMRPSRSRLRNGQTLTLSGRLRGRPIPRRGVLVEIQARRGNRYQTFGTARADRRGRYSFRYRFSRTRGLQRYSFRALVPRQSTYPYAIGVSRSVTVRVSG